MVAKNEALEMMVSELEDNLEKAKEYVYGVSTDIDAQALTHNLALDDKENIIADHLEQIIALKAELVNIGKCNESSSASQRLEENEKIALHEKIKGLKAQLNAPREKNDTADVVMQQGLNEGETTNAAAAELTDKLKESEGKLKASNQAWNSEVKERRAAVKEKNRLEIRTREAEAEAVIAEKRSTTSAAKLAQSVILTEEYLANIVERETEIANLRQALDEMQLHCQNSEEEDKGKALGDDLNSVWEEEKWAEEKEQLERKLKEEKESKDKIVEYLTTINDIISDKTKDGVVEPDITKKKNIDEVANRIDALIKNDEKEDAGKKNVDEVANRIDALVKKDEAGDVHKLNVAKKSNIDLGVKRYTKLNKNFDAVAKNIDEKLAMI